MLELTSHPANIYEYKRRGQQKEKGGEKNKEEQKRRKERKEYFGRGDVLLRDMVPIGGNQVIKSTKLRKLFKEVPFVIYIPILSFKIC